MPTFIIRSTSTYKFLTRDTAPLKFSEEYPAAKLYTSKTESIRVRDAGNASGYDLEVIEGYGTARERKLA